MAKQNELLTLKRASLILGLCGEYKKRWDSCCTKEDLIKLSMDANGVEFMADSIAFGWGLSKEYLTKEFSEYINGKYLIREKGYTSEMFVGLTEDKIKPRSTLSLFVGCNCTILLQNHFVGKIYTCGGSNIEIDTGDCIMCELYIYGSNNNIRILGDDTNVRKTEITGSQWRKV